MGSRSRRLPNKLHRRFVKTQLYARESGLAISEPSADVIKIAEGIVWRGARAFQLQDTFSDLSNNSEWYFYFHSSSGAWDFIEDASAFNNGYYDSSGGLLPLSSSYYTINWLYRGIEDHQHGYYILGTSQYVDLPTAVAIAAPPEIPSAVSSHAMLVGRMIVQSGSSTVNQIDSAFTVEFASAPINDHNALSDLMGGAVNQYYHLTSAEYNSLQTTGGSGISGYSGYSGKSGYSGYSGISAYSGYSGFSGYSGVSGYSGFSAYSGFSGYSSDSGFSGYSGFSAYSGYSGKSGYSGYSGISAYSGYSGISAYSGYSGISAYSGYSGFSAYSGYSGISAYSGYSGISAYSGYSGKSGYSGYSGTTPVTEPLFIMVGPNNTNASLRTLASSLTWLKTNMTGNTTLYLAFGSETIGATQTINLPYNLNITGGGYNQTFLYPSSSLMNSPMFTISTNASFQKLILDGSVLATYGTHTGENAINFINSGTYSEFKDSMITNFNKGLNITNNAELWVFESGINNCVAAGVEINSTVSESIYRSMAVDYNYDLVGINIEKGSNIFISSQGDQTKLNAGQTFIAKPNTTSASFADFAIESCVWNSSGSFISTGFDFTRTDGRDADLVLMNNIGIENKNPHAKINVIANTNTTTISSNNWAKIDFVTTSTYVNKLKVENNKITYLPSHNKDMIIWISGTMTTSTQAATITFAIIKNGITTTTYGNMTIFMDQNAHAFNFSSIVYLQAVTKNDFFELYAIASTNETIILQDLNMFVDTR